VEATDKDIHSSLLHYQLWLMAVLSFVA